MTHYLVHHKRRFFVGNMTSIENRPTLYALAPTGTFTEKAGQDVIERGLVKPETTLVLLPNLSEVISYVIRKKALGIVPIENSSGGHVKETLAALSEDDCHLRILGEYPLAIIQSLFYQPIEEIQAYASKDNALKQCRRTIGNAPTLGLDSTAEAVALAASEPQIAAIGAPWAGAQWVKEGRLIKVDGVQDDPNNTTRFVLIAPYSHEAPPPTGQDKTTLLLTLEHKPGTLYRCLKTLAEKGVNLSQIKSASQNENGIKMLITLQGHEDDVVVAETLRELGRVAKNMRSFGSYPQAPEIEIISQAPSFEELIAIHKEEILSNNGNGRKGQTTVGFTLIDQPGALMKAVESFARRGINLEAIDSLPSGILDTYLFYLSFTADPKDPDATIAAKTAIEELKANCANFIEF